MRPTPPVLSLTALLCWSICLAPFAISNLQAKDAPAAISLFNGTDLTGWKIPQPNPFWTVREGVLTGTNDPAKSGSMLWTTGEYKDFELEAESKWEGDIDSGFMLRKPELQLQLGVSRSLKTDMTGCFYTGKYPAEAQAKDRAKLLKPGEWNHFRLRAQGEQFTVWINGTEAVSWKSPQYAGSAPIGLQIHGGLAMTVHFKNIKIKSLE